MTSQLQINMDTLVQVIKVLDAASYVSGKSDIQESDVKMIVQESTKWINSGSSQYHLNLIVAELINAVQLGDSEKWEQNCFAHT